MKRVAKVLIKDGSDRVLILRRSKTHPLYPLHLDLPGGVIERGEDDRVGAVREVAEEAGLTILPSDLKLEFEEPGANGFIYILYSAQISDSQPSVTISWEHDQHEWILVDELLNKPLPDNVDTYYMRVLKQLGA